MDTTKIGAVTFTHAPTYTGEVEISRGSTTLKVPFAALEKIVSDKVRNQAIEAIEQMSPSEVLSLSLSKKK